MTTVTVNFLPCHSQELPGTIVYRITHNKSTRQISSELKLFNHEWDFKKGRPLLPDNSKREDYLWFVKDKIESDLKCLDQIICRCKKTRTRFTPDHIIKEFQSCNTDSSLFNYMNGIIRNLLESRQTSTANNYQCALKSFIQFRNGTDIPLAGIDSTILEDYQARLKEKGLTWNSISFYIRILRAVYNRAIRQKLTIDRHPFINVFTGNEKTRKRAISHQDIKRIRQLDLSNYPTLDHARDIFIFLFLCRGMSFVDAAFLKKCNIINGAIVYRRHKTGRQLQIKIVDQINEILNKYPCPDSPFLLPIIIDRGKKPITQYRSALRTLNKNLKIIGTMANLPINLTTYVSRHSWATIAKTKNIPLSVISDALGHESLLTTQIYLDSIGASDIDRANELVIEDL